MVFGPAVTSTGHRSTFHSLESESVELTSNGSLLAGCPYVIQFSISLLPFFLIILIIQEFGPQCGVDRHGDHPFLWCCFHLIYLLPATCSEISTISVFTNDFLRFFNTFFVWMCFLFECVLSFTREKK